MNNPSLQELCRSAASYAKSCGAENCIVAAVIYNSTEIEVRESALEYIERSIQRHLDIEIFLNGRYSVHTITDLQNMERHIQHAVSITKALSPDTDRCITDASLFPRSMRDNLELYDPSVRRINETEAITSAKEIESFGRAADKSVISVTAHWNHGWSERFTLFSNGFEGCRTSSFISAGAETTVIDKKNNTRPEAGYSSMVRHRHDLPGNETAGRESANRALIKIGQQKTASGSYPLVVENRAAVRLISSFIAALSAEKCYHKNSFLCGMRSKQAASPILSVIDDPFLPRGLGSRNFDSDGIAARPRVFLEEGIVKEYFTSWFYSIKTGMHPTTGSRSNIVVQPGTRTPAHVRKDLGTCIMVTNFIGGNTNMTTGDFSIGIQGQLIKNGRMVQPVNEMNISGNMLELFENLAEICNDPYPYSTVKCPSLVFTDVHVSGL